MTVSEKGYGKRSALDEIKDIDGVETRVPVYRVTNRGTKGVKTMNVTEKTGHLVAFESVNDDNDLIIINESGITIRIRVADIRVMGRYTQGVRIINLEKRADSIASVCCVPTDPEEQVEEVEAGEALPEIDQNEIDAEAEEPETEESEADDDQESEE